MSFISHAHSDQLLLRILGLHQVGGNANELCQPINYYVCYGYENEK